eukprot:gene7331-14954_t
MTRIKDRERLRLVALYGSGAKGVMKLKGRKRKDEFLYTDRDNLSATVKIMDTISRDISAMDSIPDSQMRLNDIQIILRENLQVHFSVPEIAALVTQFKSCIQAENNITYIDFVQFLTCLKLLRRSMRDQSRHKILQENSTWENTHEYRDTSSAPTPLPCVETNKQTLIKALTKLNDAVQALRRTDNNRLQILTNNINSGALDILTLQGYCFQNLNIRLNIEECSAIIKYTDENHTDTIPLPFLQRQIKLLSHNLHCELSQSVGYSGRSSSGVGVSSGVGGHVSSKDRMTIQLQRRNQSQSQLLLPPIQNRNKPTATATAHDISTTTTTTTKKHSSINTNNNNTTTLASSTSTSTGTVRFPQKKDMASTAIVTNNNHNNKSNCIGSKKNTKKIAQQNSKQSKQSQSSYVSDGSGVEVDGCDEEDVNDNTTATTTTIIPTEVIHQDMYDDGGIPFFQAHKMFGKNTGSTQILRAKTPVAIQYQLQVQHTPKKIQLHAITTIRRQLYFGFCQQEPLNESTSNYRYNLRWRCISTLNKHLKMKRWTWETLLKRIRLGGSSGGSSSGGSDNKKGVEGDVKVKEDDIDTDGDNTKNLWIDIEVLRRCLQDVFPNIPEETSESLCYSLDPRKEGSFPSFEFAGLLSVFSKISNKRDGVDIADVIMVAVSREVGTKIPRGVVEAALCAVCCSYEAEREMLSLLEKLFHSTTSADMNNNSSSISSPDNKDSMKGHHSIQHGIDNTHTHSNNSGSSSPSYSTTSSTMCNAQCVANVLGSQRYTTKENVVEYVYRMHRLCALLEQQYRNACFQIVYADST